MRLNCARCSGEGTLYTSRYGGNDPDVYPVGKCEACEGTGDQPCENHGCQHDAIGFNGDGEAVCQDCLVSWAMQDAE